MIEGLKKYYRGKTTRRVEIIEGIRVDRTYKVIDIPLGNLICDFIEHETTSHFFRKSNHAEITKKYIEVLNNAVTISHEELDTN